MGPRFNTPATLRSRRLAAIGARRAIASPFPRQASRGILRSRPVGKDTVRRRAIYRAVGQASYRSGAPPIFKSSVFASPSESVIFDATGRIRSAD